MDAAASVVGLLAAGGKLYTTLERLISTFTDAPLVAHTTCNEVRDFRYALSKLQPYIEGSAPIKLLGASMIDVHHLSLTLGASVFTFSRLEKKLGRLIAWDQLEKPDERLVARSMDTLSRLRWLRGEGDISLLVQNIQQHKSSLNLLLTVLMSETLSEAEEGRARLEDGITDVISRLSGKGQPGQSIPAPVANRGNLLNINLSPTGTIVDSSSIMTTSSVYSRLYRHSFESALFSSRPYRTITNSSGISIATSQRRGTRWSLNTGGSNTSVFSLPITTFELSGVTLAETNIGEIALPIHLDGLYNPWWYDTKSMVSHSDSITLSNITSIALLGPKGRELALLEAAKTGDSRTALRMIELGVDIEKADNQGRTALIHAVRCKQDGMIRLFLNQGAFIDRQDAVGHTALHNAISGGDETIIGLLLDRGAEINGRRVLPSYPFHWAIKSGHLPIIKLLLARGADVHRIDGLGNSPFHIATRIANRSVIELLLEQAADIHGKNKAGHSPMHIAAKSSRTWVIQLLMERGADIHVKDELGDCPIHCAVQSGHVAATEYLLDRGAHIHGRNIAGNNSLHIASGSALRSVVELLLQRGADIHERNRCGDSPIHIAVESAHKSVAELLLDRGANIHEKNGVGESPIHIAVEFAHLSIAMLLLNRGADIHGRAESGEGPIHIAARLYHTSIIELLLERGADIDGKTESGETPTDITKRLGHNSISSIFQNENG